MEQCHLSTLNKNGKFNFFEINHNSRESSDLPLIINVAACVKHDRYSKCDNRHGRLDYFLIYMISGMLRVKTEHGVKDIKENSLVIIPPKTPYCIETLETPFCYLCVHFTGSLALAKPQEYGLELFPQVNRLSANNHMQLRFKTLFEAIAKNDEWRDRELGLLLERLFVEACRGIRQAVTDHIPLSKSVRYVNELYTTEIKITDLARLEGMCMTSYNLAFKKQMGMPPSKYIIQLRMTYAMELLSTSDIAVGQISSACGYNDINFFSRAFKSFTGMSPTQYRAKFRG